MHTGKICSISIFNKKFYLNAVNGFLESLAENHKNKNNERFSNFKEAVIKILELRIDNAYPGCDGIINIDIYLTEDYIEISINDKGIPCWIDDFKSEKVDSIGMENLGKDGQRIFVRMYLMNKIVFKEPDPYPEMKVLDTNISIKRVETEQDVLEAIRCIYSEYGYSYSYQKFYYVDSFMNSIKKNKIMSFLAVNEHGQTAGHFALVFSDKFKNMPEISTVVTRKEFRGLGLFAKFMDYSIELGKANNFRALMGQPVAFHPMSQKAFIKAGFTATSLLLSYINAEIESEYNKNNQRLDLFASIKILDESACSVIYPPEEIKLFIENIFKKANYSYEIGGRTSKAKETQINVHTSRHLKTTRIILSSADDFFERILRETVKDSIKNKLDMVELMISLNDPSCEYAYEIAKKCDFKLSGILPGSETADYIIMQLLLSSDYDYDCLIAVGDYEDLKNEIVELNK